MHIPLNTRSDMAIKISAEELENVYPGMSLPLADGSGYVAELGVYHQLHCVVSGLNLPEAQIVLRALPLC